MQELIQLKDKFDAHFEKCAKTLHEIESVHENLRLILLNQKK